MFKDTSRKIYFKKNQALIALISTKILNTVWQLLESILVINFEDVCALNTVDKSPFYIFAQAFFRNMEVFSVLTFLHIIPWDSIVLEFFFCTEFAFF